MQEKEKAYRKKWTPGELDILESHAAEGMARLTELLPDRMINSIRGKACSLGLKIARAKCSNQRYLECANRPYLNTGNFLDRQPNGRFRYESCLTRQRK